MQEYLDVLNPEQKAAVIHENNPLLILEQVLEKLELSQQKLRI